MHSFLGDKETMDELEIEAGELTIKAFQPDKLPSKRPVIGGCLDLRLARDVLPYLSQLHGEAILCQKPDPLARGHCSDLQGGVQVHMSDGVKEGGWVAWQVPWIWYTCVTQDMISIHG